MIRASKLALLWLVSITLLNSGVLLADESAPKGAETEQAAAVEKVEGSAGTEHQDDHKGDAHDAAHHGPPLEFTRDLALWSFVVFVGFLFVLKKAAWGPMIAGLDKREAGIRNAIAQAEDNQRKSKALLAEYEQKLKAAEETVQAMVAEAKRDAERTSQDIIASAQKEVSALRDRARDEINQAKDAALAEVFTSVQSQVIRATEHVLGRALNDGDQDRLVGEALAGVSR
ncbi:MAG: F0F1 ATP synthase subunit B [Planctomyces sp.]|nr:F0F1 ATP synthase subunit B [Planctomyces sp.]